MEGGNGVEERAAGDEEGLDDPGSVIGIIRLQQAIGEERRRRGRELTHSYPCPIVLAKRFQRQSLPR